MPARGMSPKYLSIALVLYGEREHHAIMHSKITKSGLTTMEKVCCYDNDVVEA